MKILDVLRESQGYKVSYSAVVLDQKSKEAILNHLSIPNDWKIICHHMTIKMGELPENMKGRINEKVTLKVSELGKSDKAIAVKVDTYLSQNAIPHITVAINAKAGAKPKDSNDIKEWTPLDETFTVSGRIEEVLFQQPFKAAGSPKILNVFDFDGTLMNSPLPAEGKEKYKIITGEEWPHKGWWGQLDSLRPFDVKPIDKVMELYKQHSSLPDSVTILMTNRIAKFEPVVKDKIKGIYTFDYYDFKNDNREKPDRIRDIIKNNPSIEVVNIFDDMDDQIERFIKFKQDNPQLEINITQV